MNIYLKENMFQEHTKLLQRRIKERIPVNFTNAGMEITLSVDSSIGAKESFVIEKKEQGWMIKGADELGLYFGIGKFLHSAKWTEDAFIPNPPKGLIAPACSYRVIYFSVHNYNWYQMSSIEELEEYMENMLLWGYNGIHCIIPVMNLYSLTDELFEHSVQASRRLFLLAKKYGMKTSFGINPNQGLLTAPHEWDADPSFDTIGNVRGHFGRNICPAKEGSLEYLRNLWVQMLEQYRDIGLDYIQMWPYDEGGCGCKECRPWGAKGYCDLCIEVYKDAVQLYPNAEYVLSCWLYDRPEDQGEYEGLYQRLKTDMAWVDYLMIDAHAEFPRYPLEHDVIKPVINFPEISMWKLYPWGGYGANPMPKRFQEIWDSSKRILQGGQPYSEGIYEDILKIQFIGYYWEPDKHYREILAEYIRYEYDENVVDEVLELMELIEENHVLLGHDEMFCIESARRATQLAESVNERLGERAKTSWRWRILYIRAITDEKRYQYAIDHKLEGKELFDIVRHYGGSILRKDPVAMELFDELYELYHCVPFNHQNQFTLVPADGFTVWNDLSYEEYIEQQGKPTP